MAVLTLSCKGCNTVQSEAINTKKRQYFYPWFSAVLGGYPGLDFYCFGECKIRYLSLPLKLENFDLLPLTLNSSIVDILLLISP